MMGMILKLILTVVELIVELAHQFSNNYFAVTPSFFDEDYFLLSVWTHMKGLSHVSLVSLVT